MLINERSKAAFAKAIDVIPGGVNSPVRAFKSVGGCPLFIASAKGSQITDIDNNTYLDYVSSWGPLILGHAPEQIITAIRETASKGTSFGAPTEAETELAALMIAMTGTVEKVRFVNSGTEAAMSAVRLARGYTGRDKIIKFEGCFHGHADSFLIAAGSGALTLGIPDSPGVTKSLAADTLIAEYNNLASVEKIFAQHPDSIAAVIVEPVAGNMGVVLPENDFLPKLREITRKYDSLLIFDEVITGFRLAQGGAAEVFGVKPDITVYGKIIGGGLPVGAYAGKAGIMDNIAPQGKIYQSGTLSGNPLAIAAGLAMLKTIDNDSTFYTRLETKAAQLADGLLNNYKSLGVPVVLNRIGSMMTFFFTKLQSVSTFQEAKTSDAEFYAKLFHSCLEEGLYFAPSPYEALFVSAAHNEGDIENTIARHYKALKKIL